VTYVVAINTVGNALVVDAEAEQPAICPKGGFGGLGGGIVKYDCEESLKEWAHHYI
jgi:dihydroorotate dehydrogenase (fumarate)